MRRRKISSYTLYYKGGGYETVKANRLEEAIRKRRNSKRIDSYGFSMK